MLLVSIVQIEPRRIITTSVHSSMVQKIMLRARGVPAVGTFKGEIVYDRVSEMPSTVC
jgi:hypothetical protein